MKHYKNLVVGLPQAPVKAYIEGFQCYSHIDTTVS